MFLWGSDKGAVCRECFALFACGRKFLRCPSTTTVSILTSFLSHCITTPRNRISRTEDQVVSFWMNLILSRSDCEDGSSQHLGGCMLVQAGRVEHISLHSKPVKVQVQACSIRYSLTISILVVWTRSSLSRGERSESESTGDTSMIGENNEQRETGSSIVIASAHGCCVAISFMSKLCASEESNQPHIESLALGGIEISISRHQTRRWLSTSCQVSTRCHFRTN
jgi:hypothetical protein